MNTTFGQYEVCNFAQCFGGAEDRIGKEASTGVGYKGNQCQPNLDLGNWYSLPPYDASLCPGYGNGPIGINGSIWFGCGWSVVEKVKTINGSCLIEVHDFIKVGCLADFSFPFSAATKIWQAAFASDDPTQGGCPDISSLSSSSENFRSVSSSVTETRHSLNSQIEDAYRSVAQVLSQRI